MKLQIKKNSQPFKEMQKAFADPTAIRKLFPILGTLLVRDAKAGAREKIGGNFGQQIAQSVRYEDRQNTLTVGATHPVAKHKHFGGTITAPGKGPGAKGAKALTIPISERAKGKTARQFNNTFILARPGKNAIIMQTVNGVALPLFVLVKSVTQRGVHWFPEGRRVEKNMRRAMQIWLASRR